MKEVDIAPTQRETIRERIQESETPSRKLFNDVQLEIFHVMKRDSFRQFTLHSSFNER